MTTVVDEANAPDGDGRTARRHRNRELVLDAVLELFAEGTLEPGAGEVADRSGVSLRSVYRYFDDTEALIRAAIARNMENVAPLFELEGVGEGPLADRIDRIVAGRFRLYEEIAPMMRATLKRASENALLRENLDQSFLALRKQVEAMFARELAALAADDAEEVAAALDVLLTFQSMEHLRAVRGLSGPESRRVITRTVTALLA